MEREERLLWIHEGSGRDDGCLGGEEGMEIIGGVFGDVTGSLR